MPSILGHLRVIDHLQQQIAQFALQGGPVGFLDRVRDLVGFLYRVGAMLAKSCSMSHGQPVSGSRSAAMIARNRVTLPSGAKMIGSCGTGRPFQRATRGHGGNDQQPGNRQRHDGAIAARIVHRDADQRPTDRRAIFRRLRLAP